MESKLDANAHARVDIAKAKGRLINAEKKRGLCENFGEKEIRKLEDKYSDYRYGRNDVWPLIMEFADWCNHYTGPGVHKTWANRAKWGK